MEFYVGDLILCVKTCLGKSVLYNKGAIYDVTDKNKDEFNSGTLNQNFRLYGCISTKIVTKD